MRNLKKKALLLFVFVLAFSVFAAGCSNNNNDGASNNSGNENEASSENNEAQNDNTGEKVTLLYVTPGSEPTEAQKRWDAINQKLEDDGLNIEIEFQFIGWDAWEQKTNLMLSTDEAFDNITIMEDLIKTSAYAGRGAILPLNEYLDKYPRLKDAFPDYAWEATSVDGQIYSIPVFYREWSSDYELITYRSDLLEKYDLTVPATMDELIETAETIQQGENDPNLFVIYKPNVSVDQMHRDYDAYPFVVIEDLIYLDQEGNVEAWMETDEFKMDAEYAHSMYTKGLIHPDVLTLPLDQIFKPINDGNFIFALNNALGAWNVIQTNKPEAEIDVFRLAPEKPKMRPILLNNANAIPVTSEHPEEMIQFYDWLYGSQENFDLLTYGIEGDWFEDLGPGKMKQMRPVGNEVPFSDWKTGYHKYIRFAETMHPKFAQYYKIDDSVVNAINVGFTFDSEPVSVEYSNLLAEIKTSIYPLKLGVASYDEFYPGALQKMKDAGLDKVVAEYEKQFKAWLAEKE